VVFHGHFGTQKVVFDANRVTVALLEGEGRKRGSHSVENLIEEYQL
jgi:hypothetical protein